MSRLRHLGNRAVKESTLHFIDGVLVSLSGGDTKLSWGGVKAKFYIQHCSKSVKYLAPKIREAWTGPKHVSMVGWRLLTSIATVAGGWINFRKPSICVVYFKKNTHIEINHETYGGWKIRVHWLSGISTPISSSLVRLGWAIRALSGETMRLDITETECLWADSRVSKESISSDPGGWLRKWGYVFDKVSGLKEMRVGQPKSGCKLCEDRLDRLDR